MGVSPCWRGLPRASHLPEYIRFRPSACAGRLRVHISGSPSWPSRTTTATAMLSCASRDICEGSYHCTASCERTCSADRKSKALPSSSSTCTRGGSWEDQNASQKPSPLSMYATPRAPAGWQHWQWHLHLQRYHQHAECIARRSDRGRLRRAFLFVEVLLLFTPLLVLGQRGIALPGSHGPSHPVELPPYVLPCAVGPGLVASAAQCNMRPGYAALATSELR